MAQQFRQKQTWIFVLIVFFSWQELWALRLEPQRELLRYTTKIEKLQIDDLIRLSFLLSGTKNLDIPVLEKQFKAIIQKIETKLATVRNDYYKADQILVLLHQDLFKTYRPLQTQMDHLLQTGDFNCVSSALAYMIVGLSLGFDVRAISTKDHVFCQLTIAGRSYDVETTTAFGFDPGAKKEFFNNFGLTTGFIYVPPGHYQLRKQINERGLLGLMLQNRIVEYQRQRHFDKAVELAVDRWALEKTKAAKESLIETLINYASFLNSKKEYLRGLRFTEEALALTENAQELRQLLSVFCRNQVLEWSDKQEWEKAITFYAQARQKNHITLDEYQKMVPILFKNSIGAALSKDNFLKAQSTISLWKKHGYITQQEEQIAQKMILTKELELTNLSTPQMIKKVQENYHQKKISLAHRTELLTFIYGQEAHKIAQTQGYLEAWQYLEKIPSDIRNQKNIHKKKEIYSSNWSIEAHNHFIKLYHSGKRQQAILWLKEALTKLPSSSLLQEDLKQVQDKS